MNVRLVVAVAVLASSIASSSAQALGEIGVELVDIVRAEVRVQALSTLRARFDVQRNDEVVSTRECLLSSTSIVCIDGDNQRATITLGANVERSVVDDMIVLRTRRARFVLKAHDKTVLPAWAATLQAKTSTTSTTPTTSTTSSTSTPPTAPSTK